MQVESRDYIILNDEKNKKVLAKVTDIDNLRAIICDQDQKDKDRANYTEFEIRDVVCNLGRKPTFGNAYNVPIEYVRNTLEYEPWASVHMYKDLSEDQFKKIFRSIKKVTGVLEETRIFPKEKPIHLFVKELKGTEGGHYKHYFSPKKDDELVIRATEFNEIDYYLYHELGHGVWFQLANDGIKARWIKAFYKNIALIDDTEVKMKKMRKELAESTSVKDYKRSLDDDNTKSLFDAIIKYLSDKYSIDVYDINSLIAEGEDLTDIWPIHPIPVSEKKILVSEYARKNPKELFSEAFAYFFDEGKVLPASVEKLMSKTIQACRYQRNSTKVDFDDDTDEEE